MPSPGGVVVVSENFTTAPQRLFLLLLSLVPTTLRAVSTRERERERVYYGDGKTSAFPRRINNNPGPRGWQGAAEPKGLFLLFQWSGYKKPFSVPRPDYRTRIRPDRRQHDPEPSATATDSIQLSVAYPGVDSRSYYGPKRAQNLN